MKNRFPQSLFYIFIGVILLGAIGVRLYKISSPVADWHSWRQADTASVSYLYVRDGIDILYPRYFDVSSIQTSYINLEGWRFVEFPFFNIAHAIGYKYVGAGYSFDEWGRLISIASSVVTTFVLFLLGWRVIGRFGGLVAAFVYAFLPYNIFFTRVILPEPMGVMFAVLGLYFGVVYFDTFKKKYLIPTVIFFACALLMKPFFAFFAFPLVYMAWREYGIIGILKQKVLLLSFSGVLIPFFVWRGWMNYETRFIGIPFFAWAFNGDGIRFRPSFWNWIFAERIAKMILGMWGVVPLSVGFLYSIKKYPVIFFSALGMLCYLSLVATANVRHDYYQTMIVPAIALCVAAGVDWFISHAPFHKFATTVFVAFSMCMMILVGWYQIRDNYQVNHGEIIAAGEAVQKLTSEDSRVIAPYNGDTAFLYQTKRFGWPVVDRSIDEMITLGADYFVSVNYDADTNNFMKLFKTVEKTNQYIILDLHERL